MLYPEFQELITLQGKARSLAKFNNYLSDSLESGNKTSIFRGHSMEFEEVRPYMFGDDIRHIDWRVTARSQQAHLKTYRAETELHVMLCIDNNAWMQFGTRGTFKSVQAARAAALLGWGALYNNDKLGCYIYGNVNSNDMYYPARKSKYQLWELFKILSNTVPQSQNQIKTNIALNKLLHYCKKRSLIFIITDLNQLVDSETELNLLSSKHELIVLPIIDPFDISIPQCGVFTCETNGQKLLVNTMSTIARQEYTESWQRLNYTVDSILRKCAIRRINLFTNQDVYSSLIKGLKHRGGIISDASTAIN
jgi:uncharacterized protein (DUF58 family)